METIIGGFSTISQFVPGLPTGMCGLIATLGALHRPLDGEGYQMDRTGIEKIWQFESTRGLCASNGAQDIYHVYQAVCQLWPAGASQTRLIGYGSFILATFHNDLKTYAGVRPIIVEYANGQALPGDEVNLHYHFDSVGGISDSVLDDGFTGGYAQCDGDWSGNLPNNEATPPVWRPYPTLIRAQPIGYVICAPTP